MAYIYYNPNPWHLSTEDCAPRALSAVLGISWLDAYDMLCDNGRKMGLMPSNKAVMWAILKMRGFNRRMLSNRCPDCYSVSNFAEDNQRGTFVLATDSHVVTVIDGNWLDAWDSGNQIITYFWYKE